MSSPLLMVCAGCKPPQVPVAKESRQPGPKQPKAPASESKPESKQPADQPSESEQKGSNSGGSAPAKQKPSDGKGNPGSNGSPSAPASGAHGGKPQSGIGAAPGSASGEGSSDSGPRGKSASPEQAAKGAGELFGVAKKEMERGNATAAFETAVRAWELASEFPEDKKCSELVGELNTFIEQQSTAANRKAAAESGTRRNGKPLIVK